MQKILQGKIITVVGASGYVGQNMCRQAVLYGATVNGVSRRGQPPGTEQLWHKDVNWVKGDAMAAETFAHILKSSDLVIHTVGTLIDTSVTKRSQPGEAGTFEQMNRDTLINVAKQLEGSSKTTIVYISASRPPPFLKRYITTKQEAEQYLRDGKFKSVIMRPGFVYSWSQRWWSLPLKFGVDLYGKVYGVVDRLVPNLSLGGVWRQLEVDSSVKLDDLIDASLAAAIETDLLGQSLDNKQIEKTATLLKQKINQTK